MSRSTTQNNTEAQATALIMSARNGVDPQLDHVPPPDWKCWTQLGHDGAARSNLAVGNTGPAAIDQLMRDGGKLIGTAARTPAPSGIGARC